jgi:hypothetical protein
MLGSGQGPSPVLTWPVLTAAVPDCAVPAGYFFSDALLTMVR